MQAVRWGKEAAVFSAHGGPVCANTTWRTEWMLTVCCAAQELEILEGKAQAMHTKNQTKAKYGW